MDVLKLMADRQVLTTLDSFKIVLCWKSQDQDYLFLDYSIPNLNYNLYKYFLFSGLDYTHRFLQNLRTNSV